MTYYSDIRTGLDIERFVRRRVTDPRRVETLAVIEGQPLLAVRLGGGHGPAIVVKAGSHAAEVGAIHGALTLLDEGLSSESDVYVIPCGSPLDFCGYNHGLSLALGREAVIKDDAHCLTVLRDSGRCVHDGEALRLFRVGDDIFAQLNREAHDPRALVYGSLDEMSRDDPRLGAELAGRRVWCPNHLYHPADFDGYNHAALTCWVNWDGWVGNLNRFYDSYDPPREVRCVRDLCERVRPDLILDLHEVGAMRLAVNGVEVAGESLSHGHYLVLPPCHAPSFGGIETRIAEETLQATRAAGFSALSRESLQSGWQFGRNSYGEGYVRSDQRPVIAFYQWGMRYSASIVVETGMAQPLELRAAIHAEAVRGAIASFERACLEEAA